MMKVLLVHQTFGFFPSIFVFLLFFGFCFYIWFFFHYYCLDFFWPVFLGYFTYAYLVSIYWWSYLFLFFLFFCVYFVYPPHPLFLLFFSTTNLKLKLNLDFFCKALCFGLQWVLFLFSF